MTEKSTTEGEAISISWDNLINDKDELIDYTISALMLTSIDTKRRVVDGKKTKVVQVFSLKNSIENARHKKGITYLAMRATHYWKTMYERAIQDPDKIEEKKHKYKPQHMFDSITDDYNEELERLQAQIYSSNMVPKDDFIEMEAKYCESQREIEKLLAQHKQDIDTMETYNKRKELAEESRRDRTEEFYKTEMKKLANLKQ